MFANFSFSRKPDGGYLDYYHKMTTYAAILASPARAIDPGIKPRPFASARVEDPASPFVYPDTASGLKGLGVLNQLFANERVAIIGLGGTGGFILDLVAKTCVAEIRLFDCDTFANHNAYRAPGAAPIEELRELPTKVRVDASCHRARRWLKSTQNSHFGGAIVGGRVRVVESQPPIWGVHSRDCAASWTPRLT